jgi:hypothetical protein
VHHTSIGSGPDARRSAEVVTEVTVVARREQALRRYRQRVGFVVDRMLTIFFLWHASDRSGTARRDPSLARSEKFFYKKKLDTSSHSRVAPRGTCGVGNQPRVQRGIVSVPTRLRLNPRVGFDPDPPTRCSRPSDAKRAQPDPNPTPCVREVLFMHVFVFVLCVDRCGHKHSINSPHSHPYP